MVHSGWYWEIELIILFKLLNLHYNCSNYAMLHALNYKPPVQVNSFQGRLCFSSPLSPAPPPTHLFFLFLDGYRANHA